MANKTFPTDFSTKASPAGSDVVLIDDGANKVATVASLPVSTATQTALDAKIGTGAEVLADQTWTTTGAQDFTATDLTRYRLSYAGNQTITLPTPSGTAGFILFKKVGSGTVTLTPTALGQQRVFSATDGIIVCIYDEVNAVWSSECWASHEEQAIMVVSATITGSASAVNTQILPTLLNGKKYYVASARWICDATGSDASHPTVALGSTSGATDITTALSPGGTPAAGKMSGSVTPVTATANQFALTDSVWAQTDAVSAGYSGRLWMLYYIIPAA
ncbi:hypothetical protein [Caudoviricetes sp.]|nr:hypothetical protein [Caudoviricetes sp.]